MTTNNFTAGKMLLLDCISGSKAYGLDTPTSDIDLKGVFLLSKQHFYGLNYIEQLSNATNDEVYYELKRFVQLLTNSNPNILELLASPADCIRYRHPLMNMLKPEIFLSKQCKESFAGYAQTQMKKARGLNKKVLNPMDKERSSILDFCFVVKGQCYQPLKQWIDEMGYRQEHCGLVKIDRMRNVFALFHNSQSAAAQMNGISSGASANDVTMSSVNKGLSPLAILSFNKDEYSRYCKHYSEYWEWVEKRNKARYSNTIEHGKNYDAKNMMHTFRLLHMAEEIATEGKINVRRPDRRYLLEIRSGNFSYEYLLEIVNEKLARMDELFESASLPEEPDVRSAEAILVEMREQLYKQ